ncbi:ABC transporter permease [Ruegeria marina]|uniref:Spermidine/putrescine transport system permease protein n=1 Tax=Ruegeria marina TaxID=639004 RepID=A0A1G6VTR5_9RHOB|nr:ABC transporter permease [Ruegeria marina]SDD57012.1 spermidine/putrescine transport system permease protein [Ruegeria marina]
MRKIRPWPLTLTLYSLLFFCFIYLPLVVVIVFSFNSNVLDMASWESFTFDWYLGLFGLREVAPSQGTSAIYVESTDQLLNALKNSLIVATFTTIISTTIGTATAIAMARHRFRLRGTYQGVMMLPMMMPDIVLGIGLLIFFITLGFKLSLLTIIIGHCTFLSSYVFIVVQARMAGLDPALEEASADLGANEWVTFRKVLLPQLMPGVVGGAMLAFIISMDDLVITYFIAGTDSTTLPMFIFSMIRRGVKPEINAIATLLILASLIIAGAGLYLRSRRVE